MEGRGVQSWVRMAALSAVGSVVVAFQGRSIASSGWLVAPRAPGLGDDFWRATNVGPNRAGTLVPESFDLAVGGQKFYVHPNATKHMAEYATSHQLSNVPISSFAGSVESALAQGLRPGRNFLRVGPWELGIDTNSNVSDDGLRRIRVDINRPYPHSSPHAHVEELVNGRWVRSGPLYPTDVPPG